LLFQEKLHVEVEVKANFSHAQGPIASDAPQYNQKRKKVCKSWNSRAMANKATPLWSPSQ
jgi:hypothetical protein